MKFILSPFSLVFIILLLNFNIFSQVDYSIDSNWAVLPGNYPESLNEFIIDQPFDSVDVFYVYPTLILDKKDTRWNVPIQDKDQQKKVLGSAVRFQASAWANAGSLYVPYYRQAHIRSYSTLDEGGREALLLAYSDVKAAFEYYMKYYNKGKGIILAGHSQGGTHISMLLKDYFDNKPLQEQLVAAYIPGVGIEKEEYATIPFMVEPNQIGGFVTWNTFKKKFDDNYYKWYVGKAVINPVTWNLEEIAKRELHKGFLFSNGKMYRKSFTTHLDNGVIWISLPHFPYRYLSLSMKHYHVGDVNLFWEDIRLNARQRALVYLERNK